MNVLSLFDGMSCGQIALERAGINVDNYYASEIDKYTITVTQKNYPETIQLGDITDIKGENLSKIDLLIGGSPCQGFSFIGEQLNFEDTRSKLLFDFVRLVKEIEPRYFLLENVKMKKEYQDIISNMLGIEPIEINSSLVSAQNRKRLYWTNIPNIEQPKDKYILLDNIIEDIYEDTFNINKKIIPKYVPDITGKYCDPYNKKMIVSNKSTTLRLNSSNGNLWVNDQIQGWRKLTPLECERLQNVPEGYTEGVSNTQRYKMLGNGWTIDIITHILRNIKL